MLKGFFLNFINIGVLGFWLGLIVVIGPTLDMNPNHIFWYFTTIIISYFTTDLGKIFLAQEIKKEANCKRNLQRLKNPWVFC